MEKGRLTSACFEMALGPWDWGLRPSGVQQEQALALRQLALHQLALHQLAVHESEGQVDEPAGQPPVVH